MTDLAARQAALVAAVTGTGDVPPGFDTDRMEIARKALLRKRSNEIRGRWPGLAQSLGEDFHPLFADWARHRPTRGSLSDGWSLARICRGRGRLNPAAELELAEREVLLVFDGDAPPRPRRLPAVRRVAGGRVIGWRGRTRLR